MSKIKQTQNYHIVCIMLQV